MKVRKKLHTLSKLKALPKHELFGLFLVGLIAISMLGSAAASISPQKIKLVVLMPKPVPVQPVVVVTPAQDTLPKVVANITEVKDVSETQPIYFNTIDQPDPSSPRGNQTVLVKGINGVRTIIYTVKYINGLETERVKKSETVTTAPTNEVVAVGTFGIKTTPPPVTCPKGYSANNNGDCVKDVVVPICAPVPPKNKVVCL